MQSAARTIGRPSGESVKALLVAVMVLFGVAMVMAPGLNADLPGRDAGVFLYIGDQIVEGRIPYRDVWDHKGPLILYLFWVVLHGARDRRPWSFALTVFPPLYLLATVLFRNHGGGVNNFAIRGVIPAQILITLGATQILDQVYFRPIANGIRRALLYVLILFGAAQSVSWVVQLKQETAVPLSSAVGYEPIFVTQGIRLIQSTRTWPDRKKSLQVLGGQTPELVPSDSLGFHVDCSHERLGWEDEIFRSAGELTEVPPSSRTQFRIGRSLTDLKC